MSLCRDFLREDEHVKLFTKVGNATHKEMGWETGREVSLDNKRNFVN